MDGHLIIHYCFVKIKQVSVIRLRVPATCGSPKSRTDIFIRGNHHLLQLSSYSLFVSRERDKRKNQLNWNELWQKHRERERHLSSVDGNDGRKTNGGERVLSEKDGVIDRYLQYCRSDSVFDVELLFSPPYSLARGITVFHTRRLWGWCEMILIATWLMIQQIRWEKNITLGEPPGFLHSWWW